MNIEELKQKFVSYMDDELGEYDDPEDVVYVADVLGRISFDLENCFFDWPPELEGVLGWQTTSDGKPFLGAYAGGDWEHPLVFIVWWSDVEEQPLVYVPRQGNVVNWSRGAAYYSKDNEPDEWGEPAPQDADFDEAALLEDIRHFLSLRYGWHKTFKDG